VTKCPPISSPVQPTCRLFNPDDDCEPLPGSLVELRRQVALADGVLFSTPEYPARQKHPRTGAVIKIGVL